MEIKDFHQPSNIIAGSAAKEYKLTPQKQERFKIKAHSDARTEKQNLSFNFFSTTQ